MNDGKRIRRRRWSKAEDDVVRDLYGTLDAAALGARIDRTADAIWLRARHLGLEKRPEDAIPWTEADLAELHRCYATEPPQQLAKRLGRTPSAVYQQARHTGLDSHKTLVTQSAVTDYFDRISTAKQAYVLGLLAADGNVTDDGRIAFGLQAKDAHLVAFVRDQLFPKAGLSTSSRDGFVFFQCTSRPMAAALAQWGVVPRKSRIVPWPSGLGGLRRPFLLGYFDGDGSAYLVRNRYPGWTVCSGSRQFLVDMKEYILQSTDVMLEKIHHRPGTNLYQVVTTGNGAYLVDQWLRRDLPGLGLARKCIPPSILARYGSETRTRDW